MSRDALLRAALSLLPREGAPDPTSLARHAGVSKALVYHHFGTVQGLHDALAQRVLAETQEGLAALARDHPHPRERLEALVSALLAEPPDPPAATLQILRFWLQDDGQGGARASLRDALVIEFVRAALKEMRWHGDAGRVAAMLLARWHGATVAYATGAPVDFEAEAARALAEVEAL